MTSASGAAARCSLLVLAARAFMTSPAMVISPGNDRGFPLAAQSGARDKEKNDTQPRALHTAEEGAEAVSGGNAGSLTGKGRANSSLPEKEWKLATVPRRAPGRSPADFRRRWSGFMQAILYGRFPAPMDPPVLAAPPDVTSEADLPTGSKIWDTNTTWTSIVRWHPVGIIANVNNGAIIMTDAPYLSLRAMLTMSLVCYPAILIGATLLLTILASLCLQPKPRSQLASADGEAPAKPFTAAVDQPPVLHRDDLTDTSKKLYRAWEWFCATIPCQFIFGLPVVLVGLSRPYPQEVFAILSLVTTTLMFSNGLYMMVFGTCSILRMRCAMVTDYSLTRGANHRVPAGASFLPASVLALSVEHWVIIPQYKEEVEVVTMVLRSISRSGIASSVNILLGMEERETGSMEKAQTLRRTFEGHFREILVTNHPPDLPNDPPGKASNVAWAYNELVKHLEATGQDQTRVVLTVADADSEFHPFYFEGLSRLYAEASAQRRNYIIWQSPVFHMKNYHRQPMPVTVGTMFTAMQELAVLSDPNAIRFPYSTYSMTLELAKKVGGWDAAWIAEDWHMGIKCFLMTLGRSTVEPLLLPTINYTPEDKTWWTTILARWSQAKRHALGFSDLAYYFMMIPLLFGRSMSENAELGRVEKLRQVWFMIFYGLTLVVKLTNVHVIIGVLTTYGAITYVLQFLMKWVLGQRVDINFMMDKAQFLTFSLSSVTISLMIIATIMFNIIYNLLRDRIEGTPYPFKLAHWLRSLLAFVVFGPFYFLGLGFAIWKAAISMLVQQSFEYEVAMKPTPQMLEPDSSAKSACSTTTGAESELGRAQEGLNENTVKAAVA